MYRVLMVAPTPFFSDRGCHIRIYEEIRHLQNLGVKVQLLTYNLGKDLFGISIKRARGKLNYKKLEAGPSWRKVFIDYSLLKELRRTVREYKPDLIHSHLHEGAFLSLLADVSIPIFLDYQGSLSLELKEHNFWFGMIGIYQLMRMLENWINRRVNSILLNAKVLGKELDSSSQAKARWVGDGVDLERFFPQSAPPELYQKFDISDKELVIVYLGLLNRYQGIEIFLHSLHLLQRNGYKFKALIMGYPLGKYPQVAKKLGLKDVVRFLDRIDYFQAHKYLALGDIAVAPKISSTESNGKVLNYLAMGLPCVCFDFEINRELAGEYAEYVPFDAESEQRSAENLALGIGHLLDDSARRKELSEGGRIWAEERFSWAGVARRIFSAYQEFFE